MVLVLRRREWGEKRMEEGTYGCFAGRFAFGVPAGVGGAFAVLCGSVGLAIEDVVMGGEVWYFRLAVSKISRWRLSRRGFW